KRGQSEKPPTQSPPATTPSRPTINDAAEQELVTQMLRRYETLCATLKAENVRSVYPTASIDQLAKEFAEYRSYIVIIKPDRFRFTITSEGRIIGSVPSRVTYDLVPKSGPPTKSERAQTFLVEKQGNTWIIVGTQ